MPELRLPVSEIFGPTLQGEGIHSGRSAVFIRMAGCDSRCPWCDTPYAKTTADCELLTSGEILKRVEALGRPRLVVITGGNPCIHDLRLLVSKLKIKHTEVHLETQGTIKPDWIERCDLVTICPKITDEQSSERAMEFIRFAMKKAPIQLKYVVFNEEDFQTAQRLAQEFKSVDFIVQPGWDPATNTYPFGFAALAERVAKDFNHRQVRFLPQLHRILWGGARGV